MILEAIVAKIVVAKIAAVHAAHAAAVKETHAVAAKGAFAAHHPFEAALDAAKRYGIGVFMSDPAVPVTTKFAVSAFLHQGALHQSAHLTWSTAAKIAAPVISPMAWQKFRESELYQQLKESARGLFNEASISQQSA